MFTATSVSKCYRSFFSSFFLVISLLLSSTFRFIVLCVCVCAPVPDRCEEKLNYEKAFMNQSCNVIQWFHQRPRSATKQCTPEQKREMKRDNAIAKSRKWILYCYVKFKKKKQIFFDVNFIFDFKSHLITNLWFYFSSFIFSNFLRYSFHWKRCTVNAVYFAYNYFQSGSLS